MKPIRPKVHGKVRLFENPILEALTYSSPYVIWGMYLPTIVGLVYYSVVHLQVEVGTVVGLYIAAMLSWSLAEYLLHRYVFHWADERPWVQKLVYYMHGVHHEYPSDAHHLFMPPLPSLVFALFFGLLFYGILGKYGFVFLAGFINGYLIYSTMHYLMHRVKNPPKPLRALWRYHHLHHFKTPDKAFGVSSSLWDWVFGTLPPKT
ncbi:MAG: sterol desaturase family protein [Bacteroidia bacterium]